MQMPEPSTTATCPVGPRAPAARFSLVSMAVMVSITLPLAGCRSDAAADWRVDFIAPQLRWTGEGLDFIAGVDLDPSPAMLEALERGVDLTFLVALRASSGRVWLPGLDE